MVWGGSRVEVPRSPACADLASDSSEMKSQVAQDQSRRLRRLPFKSLRGEIRSPAARPSIPLRLRPGPFRSEVRSPAVRLAVPTRLRLGPFRSEIRRLAVRLAVPTRLRPGPLRSEVRSRRGGLVGPECNHFVIFQGPCNHFVTLSSGISAIIPPRDRHEEVVAWTDRSGTT